MLRRLRNDLQYAMLRGNVDTRLRKLAEGEYDAIVLAAAGLPVGEQVVLRPGTDRPTEDECRRLGLPLFVKPARGGSSIGVTKVVRTEDLDAAIAEARVHDPKVIVEAGVVDDWRRESDGGRAAGGCQGR